MDKMSNNTIRLNPLHIISQSTSPLMQSQLLIQARKRATINRSFLKRQLEMVNTNYEWNHRKNQNELKLVKKISTTKCNRIYSQQKALSNTKKNKISKSPYIINNQQFLKMVEMIKPVKGPSESIINQIKKYNDSNVRKAQNKQYVYQSRIYNNSDSFEIKLQKFKTRLGLQTNTKLFIMNSQDLHIREALLNNGWVENTDNESMFYNLKWVYNDNINDYNTLQCNFMNYLESQFYNHFKNNQQLTNKNDLRKNIKNSPNYLRPNIPATYDLLINEDFFQFTNQYCFYQAIYVLNYISNSIKTKQPLLYTKFIKNQAYHNYYSEKIGKKQKKNINLSQIKKLLTKQCMNQEYSFQQFYKLCSYLAFKIENLKNIRYSIFIYDRQQWENYKVDILSNLQKQCKEDRIQQYLSLFTDFFKIEILKINQHLKYFWQNNMGNKNLWIIKPAAVARGSGIVIQSNYHKILRHKHEKIIQKYIQRPKILKCGRKFDVRQWVLVKQFTPLQAYIFEHCYCRFSSQLYTIGNIKNLKMHLTNYSKNRESFIDKNESVMSQEQLKTQMIQQQWLKLKKEIKIQIVKTLSCCALQIEQGSKNFQIYGFDILIDEKLKPWVLEVNMSPACDRRTTFLQEYLKKMSDGVVMFLEGQQPKGWQKLDNITQIVQKNSKYENYIFKISMIQRFWRKKLMKKKI